MKIDISCRGENCPIKNNCSRHKVKSGTHFTTSPFTINEESNTFYCSMFWGADQEQIMFQLEQIVKGKK